jgi:hypothetical protein
MKIHPLVEEQHARAAVASGLRRLGYFVRLEGACVIFGRDRVHITMRVDGTRKSTPPILARISATGLFVQCRREELAQVASWIPEFIGGSALGSVAIPSFRLVGLVGDESDAPHARSTVAARKAIAAHEERLAGIALRAKIRAATRTEAA